MLVIYYFVSSHTSLTLVLHPSESVTSSQIHYRDTNQMLKIAAFLDPRFKEQPYLTDSEQTTVILKAREKLSVNKGD